MSDDSELRELRQRVLELDQRLLKLEQSLGHPVVPPPLPPTPSRVEVIEAARMEEAVVEPLTQDVAADSSEQIPPPIPLPPPIKPIMPHVPGRPEQSLEATIGMNWTGWVGAIVFVLGVLFFLKFAWDQGWIRLTPTMRVVGAIIGGVAVSIAGERMHFRGVRVLAAILHGAGLAIVLASFFSAYALFSPEDRVLSASNAFFGVAVTAVVGVLLSLHIGSQVLAVIAFIGAYIAPFVLNTGQDRSLELLTYLGVLGATGATLSYLRPQWVPIRLLAWAGTLGSFLLWWSHRGENLHEQLATVAIVVYYAIFLMELVLTLRKRLTGDAEPDSPDLAVLSLIITAITFGVLRDIYDGRQFDQLMGLIAIGLAMVQAALIFATSSRAFSLSAILQSAALITLSVPLLLDQFSITFAWLGMAMALAVLAWDLNIPAARAWGIMLLILAIGRLVFADDALRGTNVISFGNFEASKWMMTAWGMAILSHVIAWMRPGAPGRIPSLERRFASIIPVGIAVDPGSKILEYAAPVATPASRGADPAGIFASIIGSGLFLGSVVSHYHGSTMTTLMLLWLLPIIGLTDRGRALGYLPHAVVIAGLIFVRWFANDSVRPLTEHWNVPRIANALPPLMNMVFANGLFLCALLFGLMAQAWRILGKKDDFAYAIATGIVIVVLAMLNFEACRLVDWIYLHGAGAFKAGIAKHVIMSVLWALVGLTTVVIGFRKDIAPLRYTALMLLGVTLVKIFMIDMGEVRAVWRILSFIAVGGMLLCVSYVYHRQMDARQAAG